MASGKARGGSGACSSTDESRGLKPFWTETPSRPRTKCADFSTLKFFQFQKTSEDRSKSWVAEFGYVDFIEDYKISGVNCENILAQDSSFDPDVPHYLIGAHYDSVPTTPGADDNLSAVAIMNELMRRFRDHPNSGKLRWAYFVNEEPPWFHTEKMGSYVVAARIKERMDALAGMICLESLGLYFPEPQPGVQRLDVGIMDAQLKAVSRRADFVGLVYTDTSRHLALKMENAFKGYDGPPLFSANLPAAGYSDHWAFWEHDFPAVMLTDTAMFRSPYYHRPSDTPEKLDYSAMASITDALEKTIEDLIR